MSMQLKRVEKPLVAPAILERLDIDMDTYLTLKNSIFPGAKDDSIQLALAYCRSAQLDILQKPVHLVPMSVKNAMTNSFEFRDVVMPGITLYRIQASRSGSYAGKNEPEYGRDVTEVINGISITYPEYCRITVKKVVEGKICEFTAKEYWKENYASKKDGTPNAMWVKRPYAQLAKCAEAQALRMAFPELVGGIPTAEEMEGKTLDGSYDTIESQKVKEEVIGQTELDILRGKIEEAESEEVNICHHLEIDCLEMMTHGEFIEIMRMLQKKISQKQKTNLPINQLAREE